MLQINESNSIVGKNQNFLRLKRNAIDFAV